MTTFCMRRLASPLVVALVVAAVVAPIPGKNDADAQTPPNPVRRVKVTRDIVYPIVGASLPINGFGACRDNCTREHHGVDILTYKWKGQPVVAATDGVISLIRDDGEWCNIHITGDDGWSTRYVHLNTDTPGSDDNRYTCLPDGIEVGARVRAGQIIGWIGDSGNAEHTQPHLHFEIRMPSGLPVDPLASLKAARHIELRQVGSGDPAATAAEIALNAYPEGVPTVTLMSTSEYLTLLQGTPELLDFDGPLLLSEWEVVPEVTLAAIDQLSPSRIEVIGNLWMPEVLDQLRGSSELVERAEVRVAEALDTTPRTVEELALPDEAATDTAGDALGDALGATEPDVVAAPPPAPFSLVLLGDRDELSEEERLAFEVLAARVSTMTMDYVDPDGSMGNAAFEGIGRKGSRSTVYYATGDEWVAYRAKERPEVPPGYGVFVLEPSSASLETLVFLESLADVEVKPLWR
jgi:Peptidase family M23